MCLWPTLGWTLAPAGLWSCTCGARLELLPQPEPSPEPSQQNGFKQAAAANLLNVWTRNSTSCCCWWETGLPALLVSSAWSRCWNRYNSSRRADLMELKLKIGLLNLFIYFYLKQVILVSKELNSFKKISSQSSPFSCGVFDAFQSVFVVCPSGSSLREWVQCWEGGRAHGAFPALFSHASRTGSWRSRSLPRCVLTAVHTQVCGFGASFWCLFALSCAVPSVWGTTSLQEHAVYHCSQWQELGGGGEHVCTLVWFHQSKDGRGCFFLGCTGIVVMMWLMCVQTKIWAESGIFGGGWPGGRSCCSLQSGTNLLVSPLICPVEHRLPG